MKIIVIVGLALLIVGCAPPHPGPGPHPVAFFGCRHTPKPPVPMKVMWSALQISQFVGSTIR